MHPALADDRDRRRARRARDRVPRRPGHVDDAASDAAARAAARTCTRARSARASSSRPGGSCTPCWTARRSRATRTPTSPCSAWWCRASRACSRSRCAPPTRRGSATSAPTSWWTRSTGPVVLELNARPGLAIQVANRAGLLPRLRAVDERVRPGRAARRSGSRSGSRSRAPRRLRSRREATSARGPPARAALRWGRSRRPRSAQAPAPAAVPSFDVVYDVRLVPTEGVAHVAIQLLDPAQPGGDRLRFQHRPRAPARLPAATASVTPSADGRPGRVDGRRTPAGHCATSFASTTCATSRATTRAARRTGRSSAATTWCRPRGCAPRRARSRAPACALRLPQGLAARSRRTRERADGAFEIEHRGPPLRPADGLDRRRAPRRAARDASRGAQVAVAGPLDQRLHRLDLLALLRWTLPALREITGGLPARLLVVGAGDPMWRGGLSGPSSVFVHASLPLISRDGTSPLLHELMHATLGISPGPGGDWIVEGLAEMLLARAAGALAARCRRSATRRCSRSSPSAGGEAPTLEVERSSGATTARAVTVLHALDREIRDGSGGARSLDDVVRILFQQGGEVTTKRLRQIAEDLSGRDLRAFFRRQLGLAQQPCRRSIRTRASDLPIGEWDTPMYRLAVAQLDQTAERMQLDWNVWERLRTPQRAHIVSFPFRRDDYKTVETRGRLPRAAPAHDGSHQGRHPLRRRREPRRGDGARDVDVVEVRDHEPALRRRQGRRAHRSGARSRRPSSSASRGATPPRSSR